MVVHDKYNSSPEKAKQSDFPREISLGDSTPINEEDTIKLKDISPKKDLFIYRVAIISLAILMVGSVSACVILPIMSYSVPDQLWMIAPSIITIFSILIKDKL